MKKFLIFTFTIASMLWAQNAMAWSNLPHGTIAYIAEQHLTPEAKAKCYHYLRHTLPFYASWMDRWRGSAIFEDVNNAHSGTAMADGVKKTYEQLYIKNIIRGIILETDSLNDDDVENKVYTYVNKLKENHAIESQSLLIPVTVKLIGTSQLYAPEGQSSLRLILIMRFKDADKFTVFFRVKPFGVVLVHNI